MPRRTSWLAVSHKWLRVSQVDWTPDLMLYSFFFLRKNVFTTSASFRNVKFALEILAVQCGEGNWLCSGLWDKCLEVAHG